MSKEHPIDQPIKSVEVITSTPDEGWIETYNVGHNGVTRIEATTKSGVYADIPYIRIWVGDKALAEFCQHGVVGVYFQ